MKFNSFAKVFFDCIMLVLMVVVYCAQPTGIAIHEYIGLGIYLFFIIHLAYNYKWIINVGKKFLDKSIGARIKLMYAIDGLLLIAFILIGLSGIMISHVIFKFGIMATWRPIHSMISGVSVILLGIHIGLHGTMIINVIKTKVKLPFVIVKTIAFVVFMGILLTGIYGDVISKIQPSQNQVTGRPKYETVLSLLERSINLINGPPEYVRNRMGGRGEFQGPPRQNSFSIDVLLISVSNYMAFIILCSIIVYGIDTRVKKGRIKT